MKRFKIKFIAIVAGIWVLDILTKFWAVGALKDGNIIQVLGDFFRFRLVMNTGGVFGIAQGNPMIFQSLTGIAIGILIYYYYKTPETDSFFDLAIAFVLGGAFGNFTDRFYREGVVDFVDMDVIITRWPTYNVADAFITFGAILLFISYLRIEKRNQSQQKSV